MSQIHPTAIVSENAEIGENVTIGAFSVVEDDVVLGADCRIGPHVVIHAHTRLGKRCSVHAQAVLGDLPQDLAFEAGTVSHVMIGDDCVIREGVTIHRGTKEGTCTSVGNSCYLMAFSHLGHNVQLGNNVIVVNAALLAGYVQVDDGVLISGNAVVHQFVKIGKMAMLGGMSGIGKDVPPYCTTESATRNRIIGLNVVGLKRAGYTPAQRKEIKTAFAILYKSGLNTGQAVARLKEEMPEGPASEFWKFIEKSDRGLCGADK